MGKYDDISPEELRADLLELARLILRLDQEETLLTSAAELQNLIGDLRRKLFAYEIRGTSGLPSVESETTSPRKEVDSQLEESLRVVREALERREEMIEDWLRPYGPGEDEDEDT